VWGDPGHGKTRLAGTADDVPEMKEVLYFDAEKGDMVLADRPWLTVIKSKKYADLARVHEYLRMHCRLRDQYLKGATPEEREDAKTKLLNIEERITGERPAEPKLFRTFVIDTLTEVHQNLMYQLLAINPDTWALDAVPAGAEWGEWKSATDMLLVLLRQLRDLDMHIVVTAHALEAEVTKPGVGKMMVKTVSLPGKLPNRIPGFWDMFGFIQKVQDSEGRDRFRLWLTDGANGAWKAKHRFRFVQVKYVDEPTIPKLLEIAKQEWEAADTASSSQPQTPTGVKNASPTAGPSQPRPAPTAGQQRPAAGPVARPAAPNGTRPAGTGTGAPAGRGPVRTAGVRG